MKFSIGDPIVLLRSGEEGHVTAYINNDMIEVKVGKTTFPVHMNEVDHPYLRWFTDKTKKKKGTLPEQLPVERIADRKQRLAQGVYLSFMPVYKFDGIEDVVELLKVYILNELPQPVKFVYDVKFAHKSEFRHEGTLHGFGNIYIHSITYPDMNDQPRFHWQLTDAINEAMETADGILRIKPQKLFEHVSRMMQNNEPTFAYVLLEDFAAKKKANDMDKWEPPPPPKAAPTVITTKTIEPGKYEIDLHIEELIENRHGLTNAEMLTVQMDTLHHYIQLAIVHRQERMVVIHGLGKGRLREEVHAVLKKIPEIARFKNEWSGKYGFGATEIYFRY